jgi:putative SOS response-associated peptidase YedK
MPDIRETWSQLSPEKAYAARRSDKQKIAELFAIHGPVIPDFGPSWNVAPQTFQPIVRLNRDSGERGIALMRWGLIPNRDAVGEFSQTAHSPIRAKADVRVEAGGTPDQ